jgi:hypothetical protein
VVDWTYVLTSFVHLPKTQIRKGGLRRNGAQADRGNSERASRGSGRRCGLMMTKGLGVRHACSSTVEKTMP